MKKRIREPNKMEMLPKRSIFHTGKVGFNLLCPLWQHRPPYRRADFSLPKRDPEEHSMKFVPATSGQVKTCPTFMPWQHRPPLRRADFSLPNTTREERSMKVVPATCGQVKTCPTFRIWPHRPFWQHRPPCCRADFSLPHPGRFPPKADPPPAEKPALHFVQIKVP